MSAVGLEGVAELAHEVFHKLLNAVTRERERERDEGEVSDCEPRYCEEKEEGEAGVFPCSLLPRPPFTTIPPPSPLYLPTCCLLKKSHDRKTLKSDDSHVSNRSTMSSYLEWSTCTDR